jgi:gliding motility-associated-like protein
MKQILLFLAFAICGFAQASHIVGGDIYYDYIGNNQYQVYLTLYRDCRSDGAEFDDPLYLTVYDENKTLYENKEVSFPGSIQLPVVFNNPCVTPPNDICVEKAVYVSTLTLPPRKGGYTISYQRCCRGPKVRNITIPDDAGLTLTTHVPGSETGFSVNSSPRFKNYPPLLLCNNDELVFDHLATDPDGDQLVYSLVTPNSGASSADPKPDQAPPPVYPKVNWAGGFSQSNPLGPGATISLDGQTGLLKASPELTGFFVIGIRVQEFRNGTLLGETVRDFLFYVINCDISLEAILPLQEDMNTFVSYCQGLAIKFQNKSYGGTNYQWDFGVTEMVTDVSTLRNPTYIYPGPGTYNVRLIVNPGWQCTDTAYQIITVNEKLMVSYTHTDSMCITDNSFDFQGTFQGPSQTTVEWDFGTHASITSSTLLNVTDIVFDTSGYIPVTLTGTYETCFITITDSVFIYRVPVPEFEIPPGLQCLPFTAYFYDKSLSDVPLLYSWTFGDGDTSTVKNPSHVYNSVDSFDVSLTIISEEGCLDTLMLFKPNYVKVKPTPVSQFSVDPQNTDVWHTIIQFTDESTDGLYMMYYFNDSTSTVERNPLFSYYEGGYHTAQQLVMNSYGCRDTSYQTIYVEPYTTIYIPNAFTPDGDGLNSVFRPIALDTKYWEFTIYDRWGTEFFKTNNPKEGWNGMYQGKESPVGVYIYRIEFITPQKDYREEQVGHFSLIR